MTSKDWKKTSEGKYFWRKKNVYGNIYVYVHRTYSKLWIVNISSLLKPKSFKSKSQALKFAKQYMRKH